MRTTITSRQVEIPDALKARAQAVIARLARLARGPTSARITFGEDHQRATAEIVLKAARNTTYVASAEAVDHSSALDRASAKLRRQLDKAVTAPAHRARKAGSR